MDVADKTVEFEAFSHLLDAKETFKIEDGLFISDLANMRCQSLEFNCKGTNDVDILRMVERSK